MNERQREDELIDKAWERLYLATPLDERADVLRMRDRFWNQLDQMRDAIVNAHQKEH